MNCSSTTVADSSAEPCMLRTATAGPRIHDGGSSLSMPLRLRTLGDGITGILHRRRTRFLGGTSGSAMLLSLLFAVTIADNARSERMYWADDRPLRILRACLNGAHAQGIHTGDSTWPRGIALDTSAGKVYWTVGNSIKKANLDGSDVVTVLTTSTYAGSIALDVEGGKMYWTTGSSPGIRRANLDGSNVEDYDIEVHETKYPSKIAVDTVNDKLYWSYYASYDRGKIQRANLDGSEIEDVIVRQSPRGIALDPTHGKIYWTHGIAVNRANYDGSDAETIYSRAFHDTSHIALDVPNGKVYWATQLSIESMKRANLDGSDVEALSVYGRFYEGGLALDLTECSGVDCQPNGIPDECELCARDVEDCNRNFVPDECDVADGTSSDCNYNIVPDECETDCNDNTIPDDCDISSENSADCDDNLIPDECQPDCNSNNVADSCDVSDGTSVDCNENGKPDECEPDCNANGIADQCDISAGVSRDCDGNGVPDECQPDTDCNANGVPDICDIATGVSIDCWPDGIPDECQMVPGMHDENEDGFRDGCAQLRWMPKAASGNVICLPGEGVCGPSRILLSEGGVVVTLFLEVLDWDVDQDGFIELELYHGVVDSNTYKGGVSGNPGTLPGYDLLPLGQDTGMGFEGAFQSLKVCGDIFNPSDFDPLRPCDTLADCDQGHPTRIYCIDRPDFVFYGIDYMPFVSTGTPDYGWGAASYTCAHDDRTIKYGGTLLVEVPVGARGTYHVDFIDDTDFTLLTDCGSLFIIPRNVMPAQISIGPGFVDCNGNGVPDDFDPDTDGDGVIDDCDGCPDDRRKIEPGLCGCGVDDDADRDGDGTPDCVDQCPDDANKTEPGLCGCGRDDFADSDVDGVPDCFDQCPGVSDSVFAPDCTNAIPTLSRWGVIVTSLLLMVAAKIHFGRRADGPQGRRRIGC